MLFHKILFAFASFLLFISCETKTDQDDGNIISKPFLIEETLDTIESVLSSKNLNIDSSNLLNYTDEGGLKQGVWRRELNGVLIEKMTYVDDVLYGYYEKEYEEGHYTNGEKNGMIYHYYGRKESIMMVSYFENGTFIWSGFPAAGKDMFVPIKGFHVERDSTYIEASFINGQTWYRGHFNKDAPYGIHEVYYFDGQLRGVLDFENEILEEYDSLGVQLYKSSFENWDIHKQPIASFMKPNPSQ